MTFPIYYQGQILFKDGQPAFSTRCCCVECTGGFNFYGQIIAPGDVVLDPSSILAGLPIPASVVTDPLTGNKGYLNFFGLWVEFEVFIYYARYITCAGTDSLIGFIDEYLNYEAAVTAALPPEDGYAISTIGNQLAGPSACSPLDLEQELVFFDSIAGSERVYIEYGATTCPNV